MLPPEAVKLIETLPEDNRQAVESVVRMVAKSHRGPIPDGETLEHYARLIPNAGERMMILVERDAAHRQSMESQMVQHQAKVVDCETTLATRGQWIGLALTILLSSAGVILGLNGHDWLGGIVCTTTIVAVVTIFVLQRVIGTTDDEDDGDDDTLPPGNRGRPRSRM